MYEIMKILHSCDENRIIELLRTANHVKTLDVKNKLATCTGYIFEIHTGTKFELYYELWDKILLFQPFLTNSIRGFAGLFATSKNGKYFDQYGPKAIVKLKSDCSEYEEIEIKEKDFMNSSFTHSLEIYNSENTVIDTFRLTNEFPYPLYNSATGLKVWETDEEYFDDEDY